MVAVLSVLIRVIYGVYCKRHFEECTYHFIYDHDLLKKMFSFAGWNFIGSSSAVLRNSGTDIILNLFFGTAVNAARGIAVKMDTVITQFVANFMTALNPQITKSYAAGDSEYMFKLIFKGARYSYYILLLLALPVLLNTHYILVLWLKLVPEHAVLFAQLILILGLSECISNPLITAMLATGNIKKYQIIVGGLQMMNLPVAYLCLYWGAIPESVVLVAIVISQCCLAARLYMLKGMIGLEVKRYMRQVYINVIIVTLVAAIAPGILAAKLTEGFLSFVIITLVAVGSTLMSSFYLGCSKSEREFIIMKAVLQYNKAFRK